MSFTVDLSALSERSAADTIYTATPDDMWRNQTGTSILGQWRDMGVKIRDQTFWSARASKLSEIGLESELSGLRGDQVIPGFLQTRPVGFQPPKQRQYRIRVTFSDPDTGEEFDQPLGINTDDNLTRDQALERMFAHIIENEEKYPLNVENMALTRVYRGTRLNFARPG